MNDGIKQATEESTEFEDLENAQPSPAKPAQPAVSDKLNIKDEVGQAIETAQQSVFGPTDPKQIQQRQMEEAKKKQEDQKKIGNIKQFLNQMAQDEQRLRHQRQEEQQKKSQESQVEQEEKQEEQMEKKQKDDSFAQEHIKAEQSKAERKLGVGG